MQRILIAGEGLGPALAGLPVLLLSPGVIEAHGCRYEATRGELDRAWLWIAKGRDWTGPHKSWRGACEALAGLCPPHVLPVVLSGLCSGRASPQGATVVAGGWRYRLAWGGRDRPVRYD